MLARGKRPLAIFSLALLVIVVLGVWAVGLVGSQPRAIHAASGTPDLGVHAGQTRHATGVRGAGIKSGSSPLQYNGGPVMVSKSRTYAIFWEPATLQDGTATHVSATYNKLIRRYFNDVGGQGLYNNNTQYYQIAGGTTSHIKNASSLASYYIDKSAYPASGCVDVSAPHGCLTDAQIQAEVTKVMGIKGWTGGLQHIFFVFTSYGEGSCFDSTNTQCAFSLYCAYHGEFTSGSTPILYANMPYTGTSLQACGVSTSPNGDQDADSTINVTSHEHMETVTDPELNAWYDSAGNEIGDKCAWNFGSVTLDGGLANQVWNSHFYILQQEWDNATSSCVQSGP
jgi:hypothetical protein